MSVSFTYESLKEALQSWVEDDETDFVDNLDTIIGLGESRVLRDLDLEFFKTTDESQTFTTGETAISKPDGIIAFSYLGYKDNGVFKELVERSVDYLRWYWPDESETGKPVYFAEEDENNWRVAPTPDSDYDLVIRFLKRPDGLSDSVSETWLSKHAGDALLYACLAESEGFLKDDSRVGMWNNRYTVALQGARHETRHIQSTDYEPLSSQPVAGQQQSSEGQ